MAIDTKELHRAGLEMRLHPCLIPEEERAKIIDLELSRITREDILEMIRKFGDRRLGVENPE